jgi:O-antigen/teichoic acid export membrane protein
MNLKQKAINGIKWTTFSTIFNSITQLLLIAILARLLSKNDFGLMATISLIIGFSQIFADLGISKAIIQRQNILPQELTSIYWFNIFNGLITSIGIVIVAPFISTFYDQPLLKELLFTISILFFIQPFGQLYLTLLQKHLLFKSIAIRDIFARTASILLSVYLAFKGYGVYSLLYGQLCFTFVSSIFLFIVGRKIHKVSFYFRFREIGNFMRFGLFQSGDQIINFFNSQLDVLVIGKFLGMDQLGVYSIAKDFISKPLAIINPILTKVAFPVLSKLNTDKTKVKSVYLKMLNYLSTLSIPLYILLFITAPFIVELLFGSTWIDSIIIIQILVFYYILRAIGNPSGSLMLAMGKVELSFYWNVMVFILTPIVLFLGRQFGIVGVALSLFLFELILIIPNWAFLFKKALNMKLWEYSITFLKPLLFSTFAGVPAFITYLMINNMYIKIFSTTLVMVLTYLFLLFKYNKNLFTELKNQF